MPWSSPKVSRSQTKGGEDAKSWLGEGDATGKPVRGFSAAGRGPSLRAGGGRWSRGRAPRCPRLAHAYRCDPRVAGATGRLERAGSRTARARRKCSRGSPGTASGAQCEGRERDGVDGDGTAERLGANAGDGRQSRRGVCGRCGLAESRGALRADRREVGPQ